MLSFVFRSRSKGGAPLVVHDDPTSSHKVQYSTVQYSTVQYSTVQYSTVHVLYSTGTVTGIVQYCTVRVRYMTWLSVVVVLSVPVPYVLY